MSDGDGDTPAVVLRTRELRDSDRIVILLTPGRGKVDCIAKGARRSLKRFPGGLPVGARGIASFHDSRGRRSSLVPLARFSPNVDHSGMGRDLEAFAYVHYVCELADQLVGGATPDPGSFGIVCEAIAAAIERAEPSVLRRFELALLENLGLLPALERCSVCGSEAVADARGLPFSIERGGVLCLAHGRGATAVPVDVLVLARRLLSVDDGHDPALDRRSAYAVATPATRRALRDLCRGAVAAHQRAPLRSLAFFAQLPK